MIQVCTSSSQIVLPLRCGFLKSTTTGCQVCDCSWVCCHWCIHTVHMYTSQFKTNHITNQLEIASGLSCFSNLHSLVLRNIALWLGIICNLAMALFKLRILLIHLKNNHPLFSTAHGRCLVWLEYLVPTNPKQAPVAYLHFWCYLWSMYQ